MSPHPVTMAVLLGSALVAGSNVHSVATSKYRVDVSNQSIVDLIAVPGAGGEQRTELGIAIFLSMTLNDTTGGKTLHAVVDSILKTDTSAATSQATFDSARGVAWHGVLSPEWKVTSLGPMGEANGSDAVRGILRNFYPHIRRGLKVGDSWTDTTESTDQSDAQTVSTRTVTNWSVTGSEARGAVRALKIEAAFSQAQSGEVNSPGGSLAVDGTGQGTSTFYVGPNSEYLGGMTTMKGDLQISTPQLPEPIPVHTTNTVTVTAIK